VEVAIKRLHAGIAELEPEAVAEFQREASRMYGKLPFPFVVNSHAFFSTPRHTAHAPCNAFS